MSDKLEVLGPSGRFIIEAQDLDDWLRAGYVPVEEGQTSSTGTIAVDFTSEAFSERHWN